jgi:hypothetical protein
MDSGLYVILGIIVPLVRVGFYVMRQSDSNRRAATFEHHDEDDDPALHELIRAKEEGGATEDNPGDTGPYRGAAPRPRREPKGSSGPVVDEVVARCTRCDMRVSVGDTLCGSCMRVTARRQRPK